MGAQTDRLRCEVCQNLILSPMNTGFLRYAVATALTVYGIETFTISRALIVITIVLQQLLPFTVLKPGHNADIDLDVDTVATALTVYGIETVEVPFILFSSSPVATALTVYGIETLR